MSDISSLTEVNFEGALVEAARLDYRLEQTGQVIGLLHGVPISVKVSKTPLRFAKPYQIWPDCVGYLARDRSG